MAQANLGVMYEHGHGVRLDLVQAQMWFMLSASYFRASEAKNRGIAIRNRDQLAAKMTPEQVMEARRLAREWLAGQ
jgi:TPR repeat protein